MSAVAALLSYHVLKGTYYASNFTSAAAPLFVPTLLTNVSYTNVTGGQRVEAAVMDGKVNILSGAGVSSTVVTPVSILRMSLFTPAEHITSKP